MMNKAVIAVEPMTANHAEHVLAIYQAGIEAGNATFETAVPSWHDFDAARLTDHRYVALDPSYDTVLGWIAVSRTSTRSAYVGVVEHSVYVRPEAGHRGVGTALLQALIASTESAGIWTIQSGVFPENAASLRLHAAAGFRIIGCRERIGCHHGTWRDVLLIERRSCVAGR